MRGIGLLGPVTHKNSCHRRCRIAYAVTAVGLWLYLAVGAI